ncbi:MAG: hypothetical protein IJ570_02120 [Prevotella sp.]|nr:hypothetical protein [Prevotella sp.]
MNTKKSLLFLVLFSLVALVSCDSDEDAADVAQSGVTAKLEVLDERGIPTQVLSVGEKFSFRLSFINHTDSVVKLPSLGFLSGVYFPSDEEPEVLEFNESASEEFMNVYSADGRSVGQPNLWLVDNSSDAGFYIEPHGQYVYLFPWNVWYQDGGFAEFNKPLGQGSYYCSCNLYMDMEQRDTTTPVYVAFDVK